MRWDVINYFCDKYQYKTYLEIGVQDWYSNCEKVRCETKYAVDPFPRNKCTHTMTSNEFFLSLDKDEKFDIIFIDGLHHCEQVIVDIRNSLTRLTQNGILLLHDCLPKTEHHQVTPDNGGEWTGDVWKAFATLRMTRKNLFMCTLDTDWGIGVIKPNSYQDLFLPLEPNISLNWEFFIQYRDSLMNVQPVEYINTL